MEQEPRSQHSREVRAARNQALFRAVNEQLQTLNDAFAMMTGTSAIACECADQDCIETFEIAPDEYAEVRANPRHFAVLHGHVYPEVERVVRESDRYVVVEKVAEAAEVAEFLAERTEGRHA
jgi:hypothetical protein